MCTGMVGCGLDHELVESRSGPEPWVRDLNFELLTAGVPRSVFLHEYLIEVHVHVCEAAQPADGWIARNGKSL